MLKLVIATAFTAALALGAWQTPAQAGTNCYTSGNTTSCNGPGGSYNCYRSGNTTSCN
jgi:uncharacterized membrane protein